MKEPRLRGKAMSPDPEEFRVLLLEGKNNNVEVSGTSR